MSIERWCVAGQIDGETVLLADNSSSYTSLFVKALWLMHDPFEPERHIENARKVGIIDPVIVKVVVGRDTEQEPEASPSVTRSVVV